MKSIRELDIEGKRVLIRADFNVPMDEDGNITDDIRIRMVLPTINHALEKNARLILCSHMGRPKGQRVDEFSLAPVAKAIAQLVGKQVTMAPDCIGAETEAVVNAMQDGDIVLLENLRFHEGEQANDPEFAGQLASLADVI